MEDKGGYMMREKKMEEKNAEEGEFGRYLGDNCLGCDSEN